MAGFVDVLLRGAMLAGAAAALGGVVFVWMVLHAGPGTKPDARTRRALRLVALGAGLVAAAQLAVTSLALGTLVLDLGTGVAAPFARTTFARASVSRVVVALVTARLALRLGARPGGRASWGALAAAATVLVTSSAAISHAAARLDHRVPLIALDAVHQLGVAAWVGALMHLVVARGAGADTPRAISRHGAARLCRAAERGGHEGCVSPPPGHSSGLDREQLARVSSLALASVAAVIASGVALAAAYLGDVSALIGTAYGVMVLTKVTLLVAILVFGFLSFRRVRAMAARAADVRLTRFVEVETGLAVTVLFAAASLTSLPPAVDVREDRATPREVAARFSAIPPRLASPDIDDLLRQTNPLGGGPPVRLRIEREWSEFNHHWAGVFVLAMGLAAFAHRAGLRMARHWPLLLVGLAALLAVRTDPEVWPLGPIGFFESLAQPEIVQHRAFMALVIVFGIFEWAVRTERLAPRPWAYVFPVACAIGGGLLLTHSHAVFTLKESFLIEVTHAPIGVLGAFAGWARWLELRLPDAGAWPGRVWAACLAAAGIVLIVYSEGAG
jgi:putative copper resistance protein D